MTKQTAAPAGPMRLFYHPVSSASMRVTLYLGCRGVPSSRVELASTGFETDHRGIPVFTMPEGDPETEKLGTATSPPSIRRGASRCCCCRTVAR